MKTSMSTSTRTRSRTPPTVTLFLWLFLVATCINFGCCSYAEIKGGNCRKSEREALLKIKNDLVDPSDRLTSWADGDVAADCCNWYGVICDNSTGHVTELHLFTLPNEYDHYFDVVKEWPSFGGKISPFLLNLTHLRYLDLSNNEFYDIRIPKFVGLMESLTYLNLSEAHFRGPIPPQLGNLTNLLYLDLSKLNISSYDSPSENVHWLSSLSSLKFLDLSGHNLSKSSNLMDAVTTLPSLQELHLSDCELSSHESNLKILNFNSSQLSVLDLSDNDLSGSIVSWISHLKHLKSLNLASSFQSSSIPPEFQNLTSLTQLDLSSNGINSSIPNWLYNFANLELLNLKDNDLQGEISDDIGNMTSLINLDLSANGKIVGGIPTSFRKFCNLRSLSLRYVNLSQEVNQMFKNLLGCGSNSLESLILGDCQIFGNWVTKDLGRFKSLSSLDLQFNTISGSIPTSLVELKSLRYLDLSSNQLNGHLPTNLGNLKELETFNIHLNSISGPIPTSLGQMRSLRRINFSRNKFNGTLPNSFENLKNLTYVSMYNNSISGSIPMSFGGPSSLNYLDLSMNKLNETLPESFGKLSSLERAYISHNSMEGDVSEIHFANLSSLVVFSANGNKLNLKVGLNWTPPPRLHTFELRSWNVGPQFPTWLTFSKTLMWVDLSNSGISTSLNVPLWFWSWSSQLVYLDLSHNNIQGVLPHRIELPRITDLSSNCFEGPLPIVTSYHTALDLSNNSFSGSIFNLLCEKTIGMVEMLNLDSNRLVGEIPNCWTMSQWANLEVLRLSRNKFNGSIPESIGSLSKLKLLHLNRNNLSGEVPLSLGSCTSLVTLDIGENKLEGNIGWWIGKDPSSLFYLNLGKNNFEGNIPQEICRSTLLRILNLDNNNLSGTIPTCLSNFSDMAKVDGLDYGTIPIILPSNEIFAYSLGLVKDSMQILIKGAVSEYSSILAFVKSLDLSNNRLSGEIPEEIMSLKGLLSLNLSHNSLTGRIPKDIGSMTSLESLDLSTNQLIGEIPESISSLSFLGLLNLSHNKLSGRIPSGTQIQGFDSSCFIGNELCGKPLVNNCSGDIVPRKGNGNGSDSDSHHGIEIKWFYATMALGFIVGFWGVVGPLFFNRNWRFAYFRYLQRIEDKIYVWWHLM